jgi:hypothetical protein
MDLGCTGTLTPAIGGLTLGWGFQGAAGNITGVTTILDSGIYGFSIPLLTYLQVSEIPAIGWVDFGHTVDSGSVGAGLAWAQDNVIDVPLTINPSGAPSSGGGLITQAGAVGTALLKHLVAADGRWIRAKWLGVAPSATPTIRLYFVADAWVGTRTARFRICYGPASAGPYSRPASSVDFTVNLGTTPNVVVEASAALSGLTTNTGFYWTLERVYGHVDDVMDATAHLTYATVRVS